MARKSNRRRKHIPQRTCVGCRSTQQKRELIRIVRTPEGVFVDPTGKRNGRGAYLHDRKICWHQALPAKLSQALKVTLQVADLERLQGYAENLPDEPLAEKS